MHIRTAVTSSRFSVLSLRNVRIRRLAFTAFSKSGNPTPLLIRLQRRNAPNHYQPLTGPHRSPRQRNRRHDHRPAPLGAHYLKYFIALGAGFMLATALVEVVPASLELKAGMRHFSFSPDTSSSTSSSTLSRRISTLARRLTATNSSTRIKAIRCCSGSSSTLFSTASPSRPASWSQTGWLDHLSRRLPAQDSEGFTVSSVMLPVDAVVPRRGGLRPCWEQPPWRVSSRWLCSTPVSADFH